MDVVNVANNVEHPALDDQDESVRIAVRALGDMRNSVHTSPSTSFQTTPALSTASRSSSPSLPEEDAPDFVSRVSNYPLVGTALRVYEQGKATSRVVKYGAEMMESSVKTISRPVIDRLPVNQLDEFACRQLDRIDSYRRRPSSAEEPDRGRLLNETAERSQSTGWTSSIRDFSIARGRSRYNSSRSRERDVSMIRGEDVSPSSLPTFQDVHSRTPTPRHDQSPPANENQQQVAQRSRWQAMLLEAGGIGAAVSEESMRRLKYCLECLQRATIHIDAQILVLRGFIASLQNSPESSRSTALSMSSNSPLAEYNLQKLTNIRRDVVETIRQVVDIVSKYAGGALPEPARVRVRQFILCLPQRWAQAASGTVNVPAESLSTTKKEGGRGRGRAAPYTYGPGEGGPAPRSRPASRATSPSSHRSHGPSRTANGSSAANNASTAGAAANAAQKILTLATESLDMLRAVTSVVKESLDKADAWVERLRYVGLQRQNSGDAPILPPPSSLSLPPPGDSSSYREPLPPIQLTPSSSRAHSPVPSLAQLQLPSIDPALLNQSQSFGRHHHGLSDWDRGRERLPSLSEGPAKDFDALTLGSGSSLSSMRYAPSFNGGAYREVDGGGGSRDEQTRSRLSSERETENNKSHDSSPAGPRMDVDS